MRKYEQLCLQPRGRTEFFFTQETSRNPEGGGKKKMHSALKRGTSLPRDSNKRVKRQDRQGERVSAVDNPQTSIRNMEEIFICQLGKKNTIAGKKKNRYEIKSVMQNGICCLF